MVEIASRIKPKAAKLDPNKVFVCWQSFAANNFLVRAGERLRGDHPAVVHSPQNFVADGTPEAEWPSVWDSVVAPATDDGLRRREPVPDEDCAVANIAFWPKREGRQVGKGDRLRLYDPLVKAFPTYFSTPAVPIADFKLVRREG